jgi:hypothetical protein
MAIFMTVDNRGICQAALLARDPFDQDETFGSLKNQTQNGMKNS